MGGGAVEEAFSRAAGSAGEEALSRAAGGADKKVLSRAADGVGGDMGPLGTAESTSCSKKLFRAADRTAIDIALSRIVAGVISGAELLGTAGSKAECHGGTSDDQKSAGVSRIAGNTE